MNLRNNHGGLCHIPLPTYYVSRLESPEHDPLGLHLNTTFNDDDLNTAGTIVVLVTSQSDTDTVRTVTRSRHFTINKFTILVTA